MLVLTDAAAEAVKSYTSAGQAPEGAGLRISAADPVPENASALQVTTAANPGDNDEVIEASGALVFLEPRAAAYLEDKVLDAQVDEQGKAHFSLGTQDPRA
jgi:iron-sulfur cluster assembly protein